MKSLNISRFPEMDYGCAEAVNLLCASITGCGDNMKTLLITSRYAAEGKTYVAMNLLRALTRANKRVVLLDSDLRGSTISRRYHLEFEDDVRVGLSQFLAGTCGIDSVIYMTSIPNGYMVPVGKQTVNPLPLLSSDKFEELMNRLKADFDIVLVDSGAAGMFSEVLETAKHCDGALMVVSHRCGKQKDIITVKSKLERVGCEVMGIVMNNVEFDSFSSRRYFSAERKALKALTRRDLK